MEFMTPRGTVQLLAALVFGCSGGNVGSPPGDGTPSPSVTTAEGAPSEASTSGPETTPPGAPATPGEPDNPENTPGGPENPTQNPAVTPTQPVEPGTPSFLPARIRRLTNAEYEATTQALLGTTDPVSDAFVPDSRQSGFTRNAEQIVDPLLARQLQQTADTHAARFVASGLAQEAPCAATAADRACALDFYQGFLPQAYRRPLETGELDAVMTVFDAGMAGGTFQEAMTLSLSAVLQSAAFVYHTELGSATTPSEATLLTADELAASLAYLLTGAPPDAELTGASMDLSSPQTRAEQARRLLQTDAAKDQITRLVREWLGIDAVEQVGKDQERFPEYAQLRPFMLEETNAFVNEVVLAESASLTTLFSADFTMVGPELAQFYGVAAPAGAVGRVDLSNTARRGILNHASFLARYATEVDSAPVRRGLAVGEHVLCVDPGDPSGLNINIVPPPPDPSQTTRERFVQHTVDPICAGCHSGIDGIGFTFEGFDAVGAERAMDNGKPVDTSTELSSIWAAGLDQATFSDSADLALTLSRSESVKRCFTRHLSRYAGAATDPNSENYFVSQWEDMQAEDRDSIVEVLVAYVASDLFVQRAPQQAGGGL